MATGNNSNMTGCKKNIPERVSKIKMEETVDKPDKKHSQQHQNHTKRFPHC